MTKLQKPPPLHPQRDLRQLTMFMKYPLLPSAPGITSIHYMAREKEKAFYFQLSAVETRSMATQTDGDLLIYIASDLNAALNRGEPINGSVCYRPATILRFLGRSFGGRRLKLLEDAVHRLHGTAVNSNFAPNGCARPAIDTLISHIDYDERTRRIVGLRVGPWFVDQVRNNLILKINPASLRLRGLERRLYGWAVAHLSHSGQDSWTITTDRAWFKAAGTPCPSAQGAFRKFRYALRKVVVANSIPGYVLSLQGADRNPTLSIRRSGHASEAVTPSIFITLDAAPDHLDASDEN